MQKNLSKELFERISNLSDTLKLETIQLVNQTSAPKGTEYEDSQSDDSVVVIESPKDVESNLFVKFLRDNQNSLKEMKSEIEDGCEKNAHKISLEELLNIAVSLHVNIEDSIELICNKLGMKPEEITGFKSPLDESVPVSLFQSNIREKTYNKKHNISLLKEINNEYVKQMCEIERGDKTDNKLHKQNIQEKHEQEQVKEKEDNNNTNKDKDRKEEQDLDLDKLDEEITENEKQEDGNDEKRVKKLKLEVYEVPGKSQVYKDINGTDLKNIGLSEETRKLLGIE